MGDPARGKEQRGRVGDAWDRRAPTRVHAAWLGAWRLCPRAPSDEGSEPDIKPRRFNVAEVPEGDIRPVLLS